MAGTVNRVVLMGRLGADPELKYTNSGTPLTNIRMATDRYRQGQDPETDWHSIVAWGKPAEYLAERAHRGDLVHIIGRIVQNTWTTDDGQKRERMEIHTSDVVLVGRPQTNSPAPETGTQTPNQPPAGQAPATQENQATTDAPDLPF